jgi:hypothetical protein
MPIPGLIPSICRYLRHGAATALEDFLQILNRIRTWRYAGSANYFYRHRHSVVVTAIMADAAHNRPHSQILTTQLAAVVTEKARQRTLYTGLHNPAR